MIVCYQYNYIDYKYPHEQYGFIEVNRGSYFVKKENVSTFNYFVGYASFMGFERHYTPLCVWKIKTKKTKKNK